MFKKQGFCFHPQYEFVSCEYSEEEYSQVSFKRNKDFVDLFNEENVNVKVFVGGMVVENQRYLRLWQDQRIQEFK